MLPGAAFAHVVVTPAKADVGTYVTFNVSVPNEKDVAVTALKLTIPDGVKSVTPTSKGGWTISTLKNGDTVTEIDWTDGTIPNGQRQDFTFSAQAPAKAGDIHWKAYESYADGTIVKWDRTPTSDDSEGEDTGPYSITVVADDLVGPVTAQQTPTNTLALVLSIVAVVLSAGSLLIRRRR